MCAGARVSPCHVMAGLVPAIHVFARSSTDLVERHARNKSGHDEKWPHRGDRAANPKSCELQNRDASPAFKPRMRPARGFLAAP